MSQIPNQPADLPLSACFNSDLVGMVRASMASTDEIEDMSNIFKAASEPLRVKILYSLVEADELCVCDIAAVIGATQSAVSRQLRFLREHGIVRPRKAAQLVFYSLQDACIRDLLSRALDHVRHLDEPTGDTIAREEAMGAAT